MNIQSRSIASYTSSFVKETLLPSFNDSQKKVALIALAIIAVIITTSFILIRRVFRARQENKALDLEKQKTPEKVKKLASEIGSERNQNQAKKEIEPAVKLTEGKNKAETKKEKQIESNPEKKQPLDNRALPHQEEQKLDHPQPDVKKDVQKKDALKPIQESVEPLVEKSVEIAPPKQDAQRFYDVDPDGLRPVLQHYHKQENKDKDDAIENIKKPADAKPRETSTSVTIRVISRGKESTKVDESTLKHFNEVIKAFKEYKNDPSKQKPYDNQNPNLVYLSIDDFGRANSLLYPKIEVFLRYLVVKGEIFAYKNARVGYCLYLNKEAVENQKHGPNAIDPQRTDTYFDFQKLREIDRQLQQVPVPDLTLFTPTEKALAEEIIKEIMDKYYSRFNAQLHREFKLMTKAFAANVPQIMDRLVQQKLIHSWNKISRTGEVAVKLHKDDVLESPDIYSWNEWRDLDLIKKEEQFKKDNKIVISADSLQKSNLSAIARDNLNDLVNTLNKRVKPGPYEWTPTDKDAIINLDEINAIRQFLMDHHHVVAFDRKGFRKEYIIAVKEADKP